MTLRCNLKTPPDKGQHPIEADLDCRRGDGPARGESEGSTRTYGARKELAGIEFSSDETAR
eukprot:1189595-Prorocentrum_minimum.AAC.3